MTGNVQRFINKLNMNCIKIQDDLIIFEKFVLVTYTIGFGLVPKTTSQFLENNKMYLCGVSSSGNMIWGSNYAFAADRISIRYSVPIISKFELSGTKKDIENFREKVEQIVTNAKMD